ncbi:MAG: threonylcarbamoyl-AMP synthase [Leptospiraceae bacterium]|nr:threonylcarbamoyl-AMP synthase [Leptospiraceae bacterium]
MIIHLHPKNPEVRKLKEISDNLKSGKVYIFPTDTVYALVADYQSRIGVETIYRLKSLDKKKPLSMLCPNISTAADFVEQLPNEAFKLMKRITPGPFTFIFKANKNTPRINLTNEKTKQIGIRIPDNIYLLELLKIHEKSLISTSVVTNDEYLTETDDLDEIYGNQVEGIIDGGITEVEMSTIIDYTSGEMELLREGKGFDLLRQ